MGYTVQRPKAGLVGQVAAIEIAGYAGAAVGASSAGVVLGDAPGVAAQILVLLAIGAVLVVAGWFLPSVVGPFRRMRSVFWFLSLLVVAEMAGIFLSQVANLSARTVASLTGLVATVYSLALWWRFRRSLQVLALILSVYAMIAGLIFPDFGFFAPDTTALSIFTWLYGGAIAALGAVGLLLPRKTTFVVGSFLAILGPLTLSTGGEEFGGPLLSLLTSAALLFIGGWLGERAVAWLAIAGIVVAAATMVGANVSDRGPAMVVVVIGVLLLGVAVVIARRLGPAVPDTSGLPTPPPPPSPA
jgi:hypothetical protein